MRFIIGLSLAIALGEFVLAFVFPPLVAYPFFILLELFNGGSDVPRTPIPAILTILSMTVGPALLITWLKQPSRVEKARKQAREQARVREEQEEQDRSQRARKRAEEQWDREYEHDPEARKRRQDIANAMFPRHKP
jgi:hypothetical protein